MIVLLGFDISRSSLLHILTKDLHLHAYKIQLFRELEPIDHAQRRELVEWNSYRLWNNKWMLII